MNTSITNIDIIVSRSLLEQQTGKIFLSEKTIKKILLWEQMRKFYQT